MLDFPLFAQEPIRNRFEPVQTVYNLEVRIFEPVLMCERIAYNQFASRTKPKRTGTEPVKTV